MRPPLDFLATRLLSQLGAAFLLLCAPVAVTAPATGTDSPSAHFPADAAALYQRASQAAPPAGADVLMLEEEQTEVFYSEGGFVRTHYLCYKILTPNGARDWGGVSSNWEPWMQDRPTVRARVITPDYAVHPLDPGTITDAAAKDDEPNVFSDRRVLRAPLPAIAPGSLVEQEFTWRQREAFQGGGHLERF